MDSGAFSVLQAAHRRFGRHAKSGQPIAKMTAQPIRSSSTREPRQVVAEKVAALVWAVPFHGLGREPVGLSMVFDETRRLYASARPKVILGSDPR